MNFSVIQENAGTLLAGAASSVALTLTTICIALVFALPLAVARESSIAAVRMSVAFYSWIFRGVPSLAVLFFMYYGLPAAHIYLNAWVSAVIGLSLTAIAYSLEIIRAGIRSVATTQFQGARALGVPYWTAMRRIIMPQAVRVIIAPMFSEFTAILKGSTLASLVAVSELTGQATALISYTYKPMEILLTVAAAYLMMNTALIAVQLLLERRYSLRTANG